MILTTHAIVGAAVASAMPSHPVLGFAAGFASHFLLDAIPHWDYKLLSEKEDPNNSLNDDLILNKDFAFDLMKISADGIFGIIVGLLIFKSVVFWGIVGALLPDFLQFVYFKFRHEPFRSLQKFHDWIHGKRIPYSRWLFGVSLQIILVIAVVSIFKFVF